MRPYGRQECDRSLGEDRGRERRKVMEQPALLNILCTDTAYRFRLDLPDGSMQMSQEYSTELTNEIRERLRRLHQSAAQHMQVAFNDMKRQTTTKLSGTTDALLTFGRFLFETLLPLPMQEALRRQDAPLI